MKSRFRRCLNAARSLVDTVSISVRIVDVISEGCVLVARAVFVCPVPRGMWMSLSVR